MRDEILKQHLAYFLEKTMTGKGDSDGHILSIFALAVARRGKTYLELGVRDGSTTLPLLLAAHLNGGVLYSVDIQETSFTCPPELKKNWISKKSDALEFLKNWDESKTIDFAFIDDFHTYWHVKKELSYLDRYTTSSSIITIHDLMYGGFEPHYHTNPAMWKGEWAYGGPYRAVNELNKKKWEWSTLPWHSGLTMLRKKTSVFSESRIKIWIKRLMKKFVPNFERKIVKKYKELKSR